MILLQDQYDMCHSDHHYRVMADISANKKAIHSAIVTKHLTKINNNKILPALPSNIYSSEDTPPGGAPAHASYPSPTQNKYISFHQILLTQNRHSPIPTITLPPVQNRHAHTTQHLINCKHMILLALYGMLYNVSLENHTMNVFYIKFFH